MHRSLLFSVLTLALCAAQEPARKQPSADQILDRYIAATGGKANYQKLHTMMSVGTMEFTGRGLKGAITAYNARPNLSYVVTEIDSVGKIEQGTDGNVVWERSAIQGPRIKSGDERASYLRNSDVAAKLDWKKYYKGAEAQGVETINGKPCYRVLLTPLEGKPETRFYDVKSGLLMRTDMVMKGPMGEVPAETLFDEYREEGGILSAHVLRQKALGQEFVTTIRSVMYNVDIPKDKFTLPEEIQALAAKPAAK